MSVSLPLRPELEGLHPYGAPQLDVRARLNVNENPYPPSDELITTIARRVSEAAATLNRYPDREFAELRRELASYISQESGVDIAPDHIWAANGSNEVMLHLFEAYGGHGRCALTFTPSYSMYPEYARDTLTEFVTVERDQDFSINVDTAVSAINHYHPSLILIASPNNPTGTAFSVDDCRRIAQATTTSGPGGAASIVVVDEAYAEFRRDGVGSALELLGDYPHVVVSRTMSKAFGAAGLRLGYLMADPQVIADISIVRLPYHLSAITQAAACAALEHRHELKRQVATIRKDRDELSTWLAQQGCHVLESDANFICFGVFDNRHDIFQGMLDHGVLIREVGPEGYLRVSIGTAEENDLFKQAFCMLKSAGKL